MTYSFSAVVQNGHFPLIRQSLKYQALIEEHLHHGDISSSLSDNLLASFHSCVELAEQIKQAGLQVHTVNTD